MLTKRTEEDEMVQVNLRLPASLLSLVDHIAKEERRSRNAVLVLMVEASLRQRGCFVMTETSTEVSPS